MAIYESLFKRMFVQMASRSVERNSLTTTGGVCDLLSRTSQAGGGKLANWSWFAMSMADLARPDRPRTPPDQTIEPG